MKIVVTDGFAVNPGDLSWDYLKKYGEVAVYDKISDAEAPDAIGDADCVFTNRVKIGEAVLEKCPNLKFVSAMGTGYDMIDVVKCRARGVEICNAKAITKEIICQYSISESKRISFSEIRFDLLFDYFLKGTTLNSNSRPSFPSISN